MNLPEAGTRAQKAWGSAARTEPRWPASLAVLVAASLYFVLPDAYIAGPRWLVPALELAIVVPLSIIAPVRLAQEGRVRQIAAHVLIALVNVANVISLVALIRGIVFHPKDFEGAGLLIAGANVWLTNVIVFALWYWELDRGGPDDRLKPGHRNPDFLFPQMSTPGCTFADWSPTFVDYVYVAFTNATAFSPTDTMPLTPWAKLLMLVQSLASLTTIALVAARAVNILS